MSEDALTEEVKNGLSQYIDVKIGKGDWKVAYVVLVGGSLFYYKLITDQAPKGHFDLKGMTVNGDTKPGDKKKFAFEFQKDGKAQFCGQVASQDLKNEWLAALKSATSLDACEAPSKDGSAKKKKQGVGMGMQKAVSSSVADSSVGKAIMKKIVNEETTTLINALKALVTVESGSSKKADEMEANIVKIAVKAYILVDNKYVKGEQFLVADKPLRDAFNLLVKVFNGRQRAKKERVIEALVKVEGYLKQAEKVITELLGPHLGGKNMMKLASIFQTVANVKFLETVFYNDSVSDELEKLIDAMDYYTQFHYT
jgi:hypothetical protein